MFCTKCSKGAFASLGRDSHFPGKFFLKFETWAGRARQRLSSTQIVFGFRFGPTSDYYAKHLVTRL